MINSEGVGGGGGGRGVYPPPPLTFGQADFFFGGGYFGQSTCLGFAPSPSKKQTKQQPGFSPVWKQCGSSSIIISHHHTPPLSIIRE